MELIEKYFPDLTSEQLQQFQALKKNYSHWNQLINVISRKDLDNFYERHVLHSLAIGKFISFQPKSNILDVGTGGGFPGIPLAILFPKINFTLIDSIGKKIKVVDAIKNELSINNVTAIHERANKNKGNYDFIVSRAVTRLNKFIPWIDKKVSSKNKHSIKNGIIYLKGGDISQELKETKYHKTAKLTPISNYFSEEFFSTKLIVHIPLSSKK